MSPSCFPTAVRGYIANKMTQKASFVKVVAPNVGLEPTTLRLRVSCSTDWASRAVLTLVAASRCTDAISVRWTQERFGAENHWRGDPCSNFVVEDQSVAGVVVSCKIPILATRVRFPGDAQLFIYLFQMWTTTWPELELEPSVDRSEGVKAMVPAWPNG